MSRRALELWARSGPQAAGAPLRRRVRAAMQSWGRAERATFMPARTATSIGAIRTEAGPSMKMAAGIALKDPHHKRAKHELRSARRKLKASIKSIKTVSEALSRLNACSKWTGPEGSPVAAVSEGVAFGAAADADKIRKRLHFDTKIG